jgi:hypothetical protein
MGEQAKIVKPLEEKDYRAALAILWTILTFAVTLFTIHVGWAPQDVLALTGSFNALDIIFIKGYFDAKKEEA